MFFGRKTHENKQQSPDSAWNQLVSTVLVDDIKGLNKKQRLAHYCLVYDNEIQNGGHLQYFENKKGRDLSATLEALEAIGALEQKQVLEDAKQIFLQETRPAIQSVEEYKERELEEQYAVFDSKYYSLERTITNYLSDYLSQNKSELLAKSFWNKRKV